MKAYRITNFSCTMVCWLVVQNIFFNTFAETPIRSIDDQKELHTYYRLLDRIAPDSPARQIPVLQNFLIAHADFEPIYHKLLERFLVEQRIQEAAAYFQELTKQLPYRRNSYWVLAKIYTLQNDPRAAFNAYLQAFKAGSSSLLLLKNFIEFDYQQSSKFGGIAVLHRLGGSRETKEIITALTSYQNLEYDRAIETFGKLSKSISQYPLVLHLLGECFYRLSQNTRADSLWQIGLLISRRAENWQFEAQFLLDLGVLARAAGNYDLTLCYYDSAYAIANRIGDLHLRQLIMGNSGNISNIRGDYATAVERYKDAIALATIIGANSYLTVWYSNYAGVLLQLGRFNEALQAYDKSEELAYCANKQMQRIELMILKADLYTYLNQHDFARKIYQEAHRLSQTQNLVEYQYRTEVKLADFLMDEGKYVEARIAYQKYLDFLNQNHLQFRLDYCGNPNRRRFESVYWMEKLATTYAAERNYDRARKYYERAVEMAVKTESKTDEAWSLLKIADLEVISGKINAAILQYKATLKIATVDTNMNLLSQVYLGLGNAYKKLGDLSRAIAAYTHAAEMVEITRQELTIEHLRMGFFSTRYDIYEKLIDCFFQRYEKMGSQADFDSIYYYVQLSRSRVLQDLRLDERSVVGKNIDNRRQQEYERSCQQLRLVQRRLRQEAEAYLPVREVEPLLSELEVARYSVIAQLLRLNSETIPSRQTQKHPFARPLRAILRNLQQSEAGLLLYHLSDEGSFVLVANSNEIKAVRLPITLSTLNAAIDSLLGPFHVVTDNFARKMPFRATIAHQLYQALIKPAEETLHLPKRLFIISDGALMNLPLEMLLVTSPDRQEYMLTDFPEYADDFLLYRYDLCYSPNPSLWLEPSRRETKSMQVLVFANPFRRLPDRASSPIQFALRNRTGWNFEPLIGAKLEAAGINKVYAATKTYEWDDANKARFFQEATQYQVLHFATHAFADTTFDAFSGLVLATGQDSTDDGILMGYEIADLRLNCDLVTLSACETGRGKLVVGEGILGLPRLFLGAGAKTVLMTQWKVDDKFTSELMPEFYAYLLKKKLSKTEALSEAKRTMLRQQRVGSGPHYQHPFYWASFVLYGDPGINHTVGTPMLNFTIIVLVAILILAGFAIYLFYMHQHQHKL